MRVLVCGGRTFGEMPRGVLIGSLEYIKASKRVSEERHLLNVTLNHLPQRPSIIIHGDARGADRLADHWARTSGIPPLPFKANWFPNGREGGLDRSAGPKRNQHMLDEGKPDLVVAFPGGSGTADMVKRARSAGVETMEVHR